jgi:hypothetical protein
MRTMTRVMTLMPVLPKKRSIAAATEKTGRGR